MFLDVLEPVLPPTIVPVPDRREEGRWVILPDLVFLETALRIEYGNFYTTIYHHMIRMQGFFDRVERTTADTPTYQLWLLGYPLKDGVPPHISFGGAIRSIPGGDPTFYSRWIEYVHRQLL